MKLKKLIIIIVLIGIGLVAVFFLNAFFGNPISRGNAKKEVLAYFEEKYHKEFVIYSTHYNFLIPDYNIKLGPSDNKDAMFETSRYELTMFDAYGAYLASNELKSKLLKIIVKDYPELKFTVQVLEEHHTEVTGVVFDFFTPNPKTRLEKNYFQGTISWVDTGLKNEETMKLMDEIADKINTELNGTPKQLYLEIYVKDKAGEVDIMQRYYVNGVAIPKG